MKGIRTLIISLFLLGFALGAWAGNIRAANIRVEQLSLQTTQLTVNIFTKVHSDAIPLEVCWGDGVCENWISSFVQEWPEIDSKQYQLQLYHGYEQGGLMSISVNACCWTGDLFNFSTATSIPLSLTTDFTVTTDSAATLNSTPVVEPFFAICPVGACAYSPNVQDVEGDSLAWDLCDPGLPAYVPLAEIFTGGNNEVYFDEETGSLSWVGPSFEGLYGHVACLSEFRDGAEISRSLFYTLLVVNTALPVAEVADNLVLRLWPNPVGTDLYVVGEEISGLLRIYDAAGALVLEQSGWEKVVVTGWAPGIYVLVVEVGERLVVRRFVKW